jgi:5-methylcytosine-specific restriction endonuclease McrA
MRPAARNGSEGVKIPRALLAKIRQVRAKRPRTVLSHILDHGHITTQELRDVYGYNHPPRAARDVRELGIPLETFRVTGEDGRRIAAYRIAPRPRTADARLKGRRSFPKAFKDALIVRYGPECSICGATLHSRYLQVDHRVPYQVAGDKLRVELRPQDYMLVCGSCNRAKSWSCEHCGNLTEGQRLTVCRSCYWARPDRYMHVALVPCRRLDLVWMGQAHAKTYDQLTRTAARQGKSVHEFALEILHHAVASTSRTQP